MATLRGVLAELTQVVKDDEVRSPSWWLAKANELNVLKLDLINAITDAEVQLAQVVEDYEQGDMSHARALTKAKLHRVKNGDDEYSPYKNLKYLEGRLKVVDEMARISKHRARLDAWESK